MTLLALRKGGGATAQRGGEEDEDRGEERGGAQSQGQRRSAEMGGGRGKEAKGTGVGQVTQKIPERTRAVLSTATISESHPTREAQKAKGC